MKYVLAFLLLFITAGYATTGYYTDVVTDRYGTGQYNRIVQLRSTSDSATTLYTDTTNSDGEWMLTIEAGEYLIYVDSIREKQFTFVPNIMTNIRIGDNKTDTVTFYAYVKIDSGVNTTSDSARVSWRSDTTAGAIRARLADSSRSSSISDSTKGGSIRSRTAALADSAAGAIRSRTAAVADSSKGGSVRAILADSAKGAIRSRTSDTTRAAIKADTAQGANRLDGLDGSAYATLAGNNKLTGADTVTKKMIYDSLYGITGQNNVIGASVVNGLGLGYGGNTLRLNTLWINGDYLFGTSALRLGHSLALTNIYMLATGKIVQVDADSLKINTGFLDANNAHIDTLKGHTRADTMTITKLTATVSGTIDSARASNIADSAKGGSIRSRSADTSRASNIADSSKGGAVRARTAALADSTTGGAVRARSADTARASSISDSTKGGSIRSQTCIVADSTKGGSVRSRSADTSRAAGVSTIADSTKGGAVRARSADTSRAAGVAHIADSTKGGSVRLAGLAGSAYPTLAGNQKFTGYDSMAVLYVDSFTCVGLNALIKYVVPSQNDTLTDFKSALFAVATGSTGDSTILWLDTPSLYGGHYIIQKYTGTDTLIVKCAYGGNLLTNKGYQYTQWKSGKAYEFLEIYYGAGELLLAQNSGGVFSPSASGDNRLIGVADSSLGAIRSRSADTARAANIADSTKGGSVRARSADTSRAASISDSTKGGAVRARSADTTRAASIADSTKGGALRLGGQTEDKWFKLADNEAVSGVPTFADSINVITIVKTQGLIVTGGAIQSSSDTALNLSADDVTTNGNHTVRESLYVTEGARVNTNLTVDDSLSSASQYARRSIIDTLYDVDSIDVNAAYIKRAHIDTIKTSVRLDSAKIKYAAIDTITKTIIPLTDTTFSIGDTTKTLRGLFYTFGQLHRKTPATADSVLGRYFWSAADSNIYITGRKSDNSADSTWKWLNLNP